MDFTAILKANGLPTTQAELETAWRTIIADSGSLISNDNKMSPFWRFVTAAITAPVLWLITFVAVTVMPNVYVKYATGQFLDLLADAVNLTRKPASKAVGIVTFHRVDTGLLVTIPAGTVIQTASINGVNFKLITTIESTFVGNDLTLNVPVIGADTGKAYNLAANYYNILPVPILGVTAVANDINWITTPGTDIESDDDLRGRIRNQFGTASSYHTDSVYKSTIAQFQGVHIDAIWFEHNAPRGPGTANAYVLFDFSAPIAQYLTTINQFITDQGNHGHGDDLIVYQMPEQAQMLTATVWVEKFLSAAEKTAIHDDVALFINAAFRENTAYSPTKTMPYSRFSFSKLAEEIHNQFPNVHSLAFSLGDIVSAKWIPRLTNLTVNVQDTE